MDRTSFLCGPVPGAEQVMFVLNVLNPNLPF